MLEWKEANPLPQRCIKCEEKAKQYAAADEAKKLRMELEEDFFFDCGSCDYALDRFYLSREDKLRVRKKGLQKGIERLQRQIIEIDKELRTLE
jgi:hypothetical protein